jgi:hypothetical protein
MANLDKDAPRLALRLVKTPGDHADGLALTGATVTQLAPPAG